ncbi:hypothetical protein B0H11DRAFT_1344431 [Mycena galericulata]|nr:hypothetical protein B0H11DRAFT_1344431 [Mycena galericulata]
MAGSHTSRNSGLWGTHTRTGTPRNNRRVSHLPTVFCRPLPFPHEPRVYFSVHAPPQTPCVRRRRLVTLERFLRAGGNGWRHSRGNDRICVRLRVRALAACFRTPYGATFLHLEVQVLCSLSWVAPLFRYYGGPQSGASGVGVADCMESRPVAASDANGPTQPSSGGCAQVDRVIVWITTSGGILAKARRQHLVAQIKHSYHRYTERP